MEQIKCRGKRVDGKGWVYGYYVKDPAGNHRIYWKQFESATSNTYHFVIPETVGQFTGLMDKNGKGKEVYGGCLFWNNNSTRVGVVKWRRDRYIIDFGLYAYPLATFLDNDPERESIGNIHENPELLTPHQ